MITDTEFKALVSQFRRKGVDIAGWSLDQPWTVTLRQGDKQHVLAIKADEEDATIEHLRDIINWQIKEGANE